MNYFYDKCVYKINFINKIYDKLVELVYVFFRVVVLLEGVKLFNSFFIKVF